MLYWPLLIIGSVVLGVFLAGDPETGAEDGRQRLAIYLTVMGVMIIFGAAGRIIAHSGRRSILHAVAWTGVFALVFTLSTFRHEVEKVVERVRGELMPSIALTHTTRGEVELRRAWDGHYRASVLINGVEMRMMVDTGASMVLLPFEAMPDLGIDPRRLSYSIPVTTANGRSAVAPLQLREIRIGSIVVNDVTAAVAQPGRLESALLGMSFLERLSETSFVGNKLILRQGLRGDGRSGGRFISINDQF